MCASISSLIMCSVDSMSGNDSSCFTAVNTISREEELLGKHSYSSITSSSGPCRTPLLGVGHQLPRMDSPLESNKMLGLC